MDVFEEEDAELFFGREKLVDELVSRVKDSRTLFVTGPSGSGKSSLVRAGLIHALKEGGIKSSERWLYETMKPGRDPIGELGRIASSLASSTNAEDEIRTKAMTDETIFARWCEIALKDSREKRAVIFIDQFEEVFTQINKDEERMAFLHLLTHAATVENGRVIILFSMRSDFVSNCATYPELNALLNQQFIQIGAMQPDELVSAMAQPALRVGRRIDPDLIAQVINDMKGEPGALPLMQFTLKDLFDAQQAKGGIIALTLNDYLQHGGIQKSLKRHADAAFAKLEMNEQELARSIFSGLIEIGRGTPDTRRTALFDELIPANTNAEDVRTVVGKLADARLITTGEKDERDTVTLAHEKLIDAWPWLKKLVNENRDVIALQNEIASDAKEWNDHNRDSSYLYSGARLGLAQEQVTAQKITLSGLAKGFIDEGINARDEERKTKELLRRRITIGLISGIAIALVLAGFAVYQMLQAQQQAQISFAGQLAAQARSLIDQDPELSFLLSVEALHINLETGQPRLSAIDNTLRESLSSFGGQELDQTVGPSAFSPDKRWLITYGSDRSIHMWDLSANSPFVAPIHRFGDSDPIGYFKFSENGRWLVASSGGLGGENRGAIHLWDLSTENPSTWSLTTGSDYYASASFSPDNRWLVTSTVNPPNTSKTISLWDLKAENPFSKRIVLVTTIKQERKLNQNTSWIIAAEPIFSSDSHWLITANGNNVEMWDLTNPDPSSTHFEQIGHEDVITHMAVSPDKHWLITASWDRTLRVWNMTTDNLDNEPLILHNDDPILEIAVSPDSRWLVSGDTSGTVSVWDLSSESNIPSAVLHGGMDAITSISIDSNSRWIVAIDQSLVGYLWALSHTQPVGTPMILGRDDCVDMVTFSHSSRWLISNCAVASIPTRVRLYDLELSLLQTKPITLNLWSNNVAISPDDHWLITDSNQQSRIWDLSAADTTVFPLGGLATAPIIYNDDYITRHLAFSPNGRWLFAMKWGGSISLFDMREVLPKQELLALRYPKTLNFEQSFALSPNNQWLAITDGTSDNALVWNLSKLSALPLTLKGHKDTVTSVAFSPNSQWLATSSEDKTIRLIHTSALLNDLLTKPMALIGHEDAVTSIAFSPDGRLLVSSSKDKTVRLWNLSMLGRNLVTSPLVLMGHDAAVTTVAISPNGQWLATGGEDNTIRMWKLPIYNPNIAPIVLRVNSKLIQSLAFSPNNRWLVANATDTESTVYLWDVTTLYWSHTPLEFRVETSLPNTVAISPDNEWLIIGGDDGNTRLWSLINPNPNTAPAILPGHFTGFGMGVSSVAIDKDSRWLATTGEDGSIRIWALRSDELIELACRTAGRDMTLEEWTRYIGDKLPFQTVCPNLPIEPEPNATP